ncbi:MAG: NAD(P)-dependent alcohol dehydrogenase [Sphingomonadales bacterium]|nr:NAD(P)-dependent alcohol dehydrogenase [Sphingomonadales bacterium]
MQEDGPVLRAMRTGAPAGTLTLTDIAQRAPGAGEIAVRLHAAALNFRDRLVVSGVFPAPQGLIPLSDGAGEVVAVGDGVSEFAVGDRVASCFHPNWRDGHSERAELNNTPGGPADGYACDFAVRPVSHFTRAPRGYSHAEAATLPCAGVTAWRALVTDGRVAPGATVLVLGTGGVSLFALQFAKAAGARVIATTGDAAKARQLAALGADHVIRHDEVGKWGEAVLALTAGLGADHVIEVGGPHTLGQSFVAARTGGHVAIIGAVGGFDIDTMPFAIVQAKRLRLQAVTVGSRRDQTDMIRAIEASDIKPVIARRFPLAQLDEGLRFLGEGKHFGKVAIMMGDQP